MPKGGLRARNVLMFNHAFLEKWIWSYQHETVLWKAIMDSKYGCACSGQFTNEIHWFHGVGIEENISIGQKVFFLFIIDFK